MILEDSIQIMARPEAIFRFFEEMENHYLAWHPDHVLFRWERGRGVMLRNVFYFEERIAGKLLKKRVAFTQVVPMGPLAQHAHRKELAAVREHMRVEGVNIKRIIEAQEQNSVPLSQETASQA